MSCSKTALAGTATVAAIAAPLLFPMTAMAGAFAIMGDNIAEEATRVGGAVLIVALLFFLPDIIRRNFPAILMGFLAFCVGVMMVATPQKAIGLAQSIDNTVTKGINTGGSGGGGGRSGGSSAGTGP
jgi:uncharacterized membrane protein YgcG